MTGYPHLQAAVQRLFRQWLRRCPEQVNRHLAQDGDGTRPESVAVSCPLTFGDARVASWAMEQNGDRHE